MPDDSSYDRFHRAFRIWRKEAADNLVPFTDEVAQELIELIDNGALEGRVNQYAPYDDYSVDWGKPLLTVMASLGRRDVVAALLRAGADPNLLCVRYSDEGQYPAIVHARDPETMRMLLAAGADVNARTTFGRTALHSAASLGDEDLVRDLLVAGADPLVGGSEAGAPIEERIEGRYPQKASIERLLREAAAPKLATLRGSSVRGWRRKDMYTVGQDFGARDIERESLGAGQKWTVIAAAKPCEIVAGRVATLLGAPRWEREAHKRYVADARQFVAVVELKNSSWSLAWADDLGFEGAAAAASDLSKTLACETILVFCELVKRYIEGFAVEEHDWSEENIAAEFDPDENQEAYDDERGRMQDEYHAWLTKHEVLIPPYDLVSTGHICGTTLYGVRKRDIARGDVVVIEEHP